MYTHASSTNGWKERVKLFVGIPLDAEAMPKLKLLLLDWEDAGICQYYDLDLNDAEDQDQFIRYFEDLIARFEQRGVLFVQTTDRENCPGFRPIRDVLHECKQIS